MTWNPGSVCIWRESGEGKNKFNLFMVLNIINEILLSNYQM